MLQKRFLEIPFALALLPKSLQEKWPIPSGEAMLKLDMVEAVLSRLKQGPATAAELIELAKNAGVSQEEVPTVLEILVHNGVITPCRPDFLTVDRAPSQRLNQVLMNIALAGDTHRYLAAPVLGSAIGANYFERLAALVLSDDSLADDHKAVGAVLERLERSGKRMVRDGKPMDRDEQDVRELDGLMREFRAAGFDHWRSLGVLS
jgi:hypothetical protein